MQKRRKFTAEFKIKVVIVALKEEKTLQEFAQKHELGRREGFIQTKFYQKTGVTSVFDLCFFKREEKTWVRIQLNYKMR